jgi:hypothetical protein
MELSEDRILSDFHTWLWNARPDLRRLCFHPYNEGTGSGTIKKAKGVVAGVPDYFIMVPNKDYHALTIEFKLPGKKQTPEQVVAMTRLIEQGYAYYLCYSFEEAQNVFLKYTQPSKTLIEVLDL